jgi:hypothetical protein
MCGNLLVTCRKCTLKRRYLPFSFHAELIFWNRIAEHGAERMLDADSYRCDVRGGRYEVEPSNSNQPSKV